MCAHEQTRLRFQAVIGSLSDTRGLCRAEVSEVDHRVREQLQRIMQPADTLETQQQPLELILPRKQPLNGAEAFFEDFRIEEPFRSRLGLLPITLVEWNVGNHAGVEDRLTVPAAIVDAIQTHDRALQIKADLSSDSAQRTQALDEHRRLVAVSGSGEKRCDHVAIPIADRDDFVTLDVLVPATTKVVTALLRSRRRAVSVNDAQIEEIGFFEFADARGEDRRERTDAVKKIQGAMHARVMDLWFAVSILVDRQFFPLAAEVEKLENIVHQIEPRKLAFWPATPLCW